MDEHQRRVWGQMIESLDAYEAHEIDLRTLTGHLQGLVGASDLHSEAMRDEFWSHFAPIDMELELRTESWAPEGSANDEHLAKLLHDYRDWVQHVLATTGYERT